MWHTGGVGNFAPLMVGVSQMRGNRLDVMVAQRKGRGCG